MERSELEIRQVVLDCPSPRVLAEFYRELLGLRYRSGDELPAAGETPDTAPDWLVLVNPRNGWRLAFQEVDGLPEPTWPSGPYPQMAHLDLSVTSMDALELQHERALGLGARLLQDRSQDPVEPLRVYADPAGHPFCVFVAPS
jgi:catechol 2,3-dioxygenase-like lactoylglutathione lyase family enzyme